MLIYCTALTFNKLSWPVTAKAAFSKDQISWAVLDPGDAVGAAVIGTWGIRFGINPTGLCCTEVVVWGFG